MDSTKVMIENWPQTNPIVMWIPIVVALLALGVSLYVADLTRRAFIQSTRPYVWAVSYSYLDPNSHTLVALPSKIIFRVRNAPAKILSSHVHIVWKEKTVLSYHSGGEVRFPDEKSEWTFDCARDKWEEIITAARKESNQLQRNVSLEYSALGRGRTYRYKLHQTFEPKDNTWRDTLEEAD